MPFDPAKAKFKNGERVLIPSKSTPEKPLVGNIGAVHEGDGGVPKYLVRYVLPDEKPQVLHEDYFGDEQLQPSPAAAKAKDG